MKKILLLWLLLINSYGLLLASNCESSSDLETRETRVLEREDELLSGKNLNTSLSFTCSSERFLFFPLKFHPVLRSALPDIFACGSYGDIQTEVNEESDHRAIISDVKRNKGTYGGGDLVRPRDGPHNSASSKLFEVSVISIVIKHIAAGLLGMNFVY